MNVYANTEAGVKMMDKKELCVIYDELHTKHPMELKARMKTGAGSGKQSVLDDLLAFMKSAVFGAGGATSGTAEALRILQAKAIEDAKTIASLMAAGASGSTKVISAKNPVGTIVDAVTFGDSGLDAVVRTEAVRLTTEGLSFTPGIMVDASAATMWSTFSSAQKRFYILGKAGAMRAAILATNPVANGGNVAINGAFLNRFDATVKMWEDNVEPTKGASVSSKKRKSTTVVSSSDSEEEEDYVNGLGKSQKGTGKDFRKALRGVVNGQGDVPQTADALLEGYETLKQRVQQYSPEFAIGTDQIEGAHRETAVTLKFLEALEEGAVEMAKLVGGRPNKTGDKSEKNVDTTGVWQTLTAQFLGATQAVDEMKEYFNAVKTIGSVEAQELFNTFKPEWSLQQNTTSVKSVITTNTGRSFEKIRAAVNKAKVQKGVLNPGKKQKYEQKSEGKTSVGSSRSEKTDKNSSCYQCGLPGHFAKDCKKSGGISIPLGGQLAQPDINLTHYWDSVKKDWVKK